MKANQSYSSRTHKINRNMKKRTKTICACPQEAKDKDQNMPPSKMKPWETRKKMVYKENQCPHYVWISPVEIETHWSNNLEASTKSSHRAFANIPCNVSRRPKQAFLSRTFASSSGDLTPPTRRKKVLMSWCRAAGVLKYDRGTWTWPSSANPYDQTTSEA